MSRTFQFSIIKIADRHRDERLNAAIAVFDDSGNVEVRLPSRLDKLRAMSAALEIETVRAGIEQIQHVDASLSLDERSDIRDRLNSWRLFTQFEFSEPSYFVAPSSVAYEDWIRKLLRVMVDPEPARDRPVRKRTHLFSTVRTMLRLERVLAKPGEDLTAHRVVPNVYIADGLQADFVLKNGAMHVIETVDASDVEVSIRKAVQEIAVSALVLEQARMSFGSNSTNSQLVYEASAAIEKAAQPSLDAAAHQGTKLVNWASTDDRNRFLNELTQLAVPYETKLKAVGNVHASTQRRFDLN